MFFMMFLDGFPVTAGTVKNLLGFSTNTWETHLIAVKSVDLWEKCNKGMSFPLSSSFMHFFY